MPILCKSQNSQKNNRGSRTREPLIFSILLIGITQQNDKLLFGGVRDKAFSWEKVAPKGPDVGRYQAEKLMFVEVTQKSKASFV